MMIVSNKKENIVNRQMTRLYIVTAILFFGGLVLIPIGIGIIMVIIAIPLTVLLFFSPLILRKRIKSDLCPSCSMQVFWLGDEKGLNCPACQKRFILQGDKLISVKDNK